MLAFITSLRHPRNAVDYSRVEELLLETLHSVTQQTSDDFVVIVVGNREPSVELPDKVHFVKVSYGPPAPRDVRVSRSPFIRDKGTKIGVGLIKALEFDPDYVMIFDADDFVHRDLVQFVGERPGRPGWVIDEGWMYSRNRRAVRPISDFNRTCGTSFIIPFDVYGVPTDLDVTASKAEIREAYGERISKIIGAHKWAVEWHAERGRVLERLPFPGAVYHVDTGENHSRNELSGRAKPISRALAAEFGIPSRNRLVTWWSCYCKTTAYRMAEPFRPVARFAKRALVGVKRRLTRR